LLDPWEIKSALGAVDPGDQIERVRFSSQPLSLEDMSKLWTTFQTQYRLSSAYLATVILIDSQQPSKSALPVLTRGANDHGVFSVPSPAPLIQEVRPASPLPSAQLGSDILVLGDNLSGGGITVRLRHPLLPAPLDLSPQASPSDGSVTVHIPGVAEDPTVLSKWLPGKYSVSLIVSRPPIPTWSTAEVAEAFALAPTITVTPLSAPAGTLALTLACTPRLDTHQRALLIFGDQPFVPQSLTNPPDTTKPSSLKFSVPGVLKGTYKVRLRVDGVDSMPFLLSGDPPRPSFDPSQAVTATCLHQNPGKNPTRNIGRRPFGGFGFVPNSVLPNRFCRRHQLLPNKWRNKNLLGIPSGRKNRPPFSYQPLLCFRQ